MVRFSYIFKSGITIASLAIHKELDKPSKNSDLSTNILTVAGLGTSHTLVRIAKMGSDEDLRTGQRQHLMQRSMFGDLCVQKLLQHSGTKAQKKIYF
jgi:hypothetical protein